MENETVPSAVPFKDYVNYLLYILQGVLMIIANSIIIAAIVRSKELRSRKEMLLFVGQAAADLIFGIGSLWSGIYRLNVTLARQKGVQYTVWECAQTIQIVVIIVGGQCSGMIVALSVDRLIAVLWYYTYIQLEVDYAKKILGGTFGYGIMTAILVFLLSYFNQDPTDTQSMLCLSFIATYEYRVFSILFRALTGYMSFVLYMLIVWGYRTIVHQTEDEGMQQQQLKRQRQLTKTVGVITVFTLIFHNIPYTFIALTRIFRYQEFGPFITYMFLLVRVNCIANVAILYWRQKEIRKSINALFGCKNAAVQVGFISHKAESAV